MEKRLYRDDLNKKVGGVCAGLAEYLNVDVAIIRAIFLIGLFVKGVTVVPYIVLWIVLPKKPYLQDQNIHVDYTVPPVDPYGPFANNNNNWYAGASQAPFNMPKKSASSMSVIAGAALVVFGAYFLFDELNILPDLDLHRLWPVGLILAGVAVIFSGKKQPWEKQDWHKAEPQDAEVVSEEKKEERPAGDNTPTA